MTRCTERVIQRALCQHLRHRGAAGLVWWHTPNGGRRRPVAAAIFSGLGVRPGVSDLILLHDGRAFALELKTDDGRPTGAQMQFISEFRAAGGDASIANGLGSGAPHAGNLGFAPGACGTSDGANIMPSRATLRMRRHRERRRDGLRCLTIELRETEIDALV